MARVYAALIAIGFIDNGATRIPAMPARHSVINLMMDEK